MLTLARILAPILSVWCSWRGQEPPHFVKVYRDLKLLRQASRMVHRAEALKVAGTSFRLFFQKNGTKPHRMLTSSRRPSRSIRTHERCYHGPRH